jgi:hypothetical protein
VGNVINQKRPTFSCKPFDFIAPPLGLEPRTL